MKLSSISSGMSTELVERMIGKRKGVKVEVRIKDGKRLVRAWNSDYCRRCSPSLFENDERCDICMTYERDECDPDRFNGF
jgi:hypothetical protein